MRAVFLALFISWTSLSWAATEASFLDLHLTEHRYLGQVQQPQQNMNYTVFSGDVNLETQSPGFNYKINPVMEGAFEAGSELYWGIPEIYVQPRKIAPGFNGTLGRQKRVWSRLDEEFNLGVWQPQLRWDYLAPRQEGLTGMFFDWTLSSAVRLTFFMSPLSIPDQGPNYKLENGQFSSSNRWFTPPQSQIHLFGNSNYAADAPLYFEIAKPSNSDLFMHSSFGFSMSYQPGGPFWSQVSYAYKPLNQIHLGIECAKCVVLPSAANAASSTIEATAIIHPMVVNHNVLTWEAGFERIDDKGWVSLTADVPMRSGFPDDYAESPLNTMIIAGFAYQHYVRLGLPTWLQFSYMRAVETEKATEGGLVPDEVYSSLDRYPYRDLAALEWRLLLLQSSANRVHWRNRYSYSFPERGGWLSSNLQWSQGALSWNLGFDFVGADIDPSDRRAGLFSRYRANDRIFGGVSYVF